MSYSSIRSQVPTHAAIRSRVPTQESIRSAINRPTGTSSRPPAIARPTDSFTPAAPPPPVRLAPPLPPAQSVPTSSAPPVDSSGVPSSSDPAWDNVDRRDPELARQQQVVYEETGVMVPLDRAKAHMMIESGGITGESVNNVNGDSLGLFQVTSNSYGTYDRERLATDPEYQICAGLKELALRYKDPANPNGWDGASSAFFTGSYSDVGLADTTNGTTQGQYANRLHELMAQLS